jgi:hypothetical protein
MYPDAATIANGAFVGAVSETVNELSTWTTLNQDSLDVPAGDTVEDTVTITVPQDAAPGERYAVVFAAASKSSSTGIKLIYRTGVRIYLSVGGDNPPASKFTVNTLTAQREHNGRAVVKAMVHNTGGRALDMFGTLTLTAVSGAMTAGPYPVRLGTTLAPGQSEPVTVAVPDPVSDGPWNAVIDLKSGLLDETYQARITFPSAPGSTSMAMAYPKPAAGSYVVPLLAGGLLVSALLGASAYRITRQRRHRRKNPNLP